ncbi:MAG: hypothetical protein V7722_07105 [Porticoccus sp.]
MNTEGCNSITQQTVSEWLQPNKKVGGGHDARSSINGMLSIFYGSLERASQCGWLNAGRTLVDKTYIDILWQAAKLPTLGTTSQHIASDLDTYMRKELQPIWPEIEHLNHQQKQQQAYELITVAADNVFGSGYQEECASWLLYYLCPQLPVFPFNEQLNAALTERLHLSELAENYQQYSQRCCDLYSRMLPKIDAIKPKAEYGDKRDINTIDQLMRASDWWQRHCFIRQLQN